ncbi:MAG TPA: transposase [Actinocrinis sp.]|nr:transposase [Actinocrinis sp.]
MTYVTAGRIRPPRKATQGRFRSANPESLPLTHYATQHAWDTSSAGTNGPKPSRRHERKLTTFEKNAGWRYQILATTIDKLDQVPGSHHPHFLDVLYRHRGGGAEQAVRTGKALGLRNLPSKTWNVNQGWIIAANIANDLHAYTRLLGLDLARATPDTLRFRLWHLPARPAAHAHRRILKIATDWPWASAFTDCWRRLAALPDPG